MRLAAEERGVAVVDVPFSSDGGIRGWWVGRVPFGEDDVFTQSVMNQFEDADDDSCLSVSFALLLLRR